MSQQLVGLKLTALPLSAPMTFWPVLKEGVKVGTVTSAIYSPRLQKNIALAMISIDHTASGRYYR